MMSLMTYYQSIIEENKENRVSGESEEQKDERLRQRISQKLQAEDLALPEKIRLAKQLFDMLRRYGSIQPYIEDAQVNEIMIIGEDKLYLERGGEMEAVSHSYYFAGELNQIVQRMVSRLNKQVNEKNPICDLYLSSGERVSIVLPPVARQGPMVTIRKFGKKPLTWRDLIAGHTLTEEVAGFLQEAVRKKYNIFVSGGTSSGKTTLLNILTSAIPERERIITIEDARELRIDQIPNQVNLECRTESFAGCGEINARELIKAALRMRPDRIIVGEVRGEEAIDMLQAMNTGHSGSLSTGHSNSAADMVKRLETMVLSGVEIPIAAIRSQIASAIDLFIHLEKIHGRGRRIVEIAAVKGVKNGEIELESVYRYAFAADCLQKIKADFQLKERWERFDGDMEKKSNKSVAGRNRRTRLRKA
ncbi:hypothetical protein C3V36_03450 [Lachnospiraceae bacterium oral taxon 500]|nr:hypothetical protein C3V36_03450 [Lachnospiraceae bacterium oral taxon 500]